MFKNVASQKISLTAFDSATGIKKSGDAANITAYVNKDWGGVTVLGDTSATEIDATNAKGQYLFDLTQAESNGNALEFTGKSSTSGIEIVPKLIYTVPPNFSTLVIDSSGNITTVTNLTNAPSDSTGVTSIIATLAGSLTAQEISDAVLDGVFADSIPAVGSLPSLRQFGYMLHQFFMNRARSGTTITVYKANGTTPLFTMTINSSSSPTTLSRTT